MTGRGFFHQVLIAAISGMSLALGLTFPAKSLTHDEVERVTVLLVALAPDLGWTDSADTKGYPINWSNRNGSFAPYSQQLHRALIPAAAEIFVQGCLEGRLVESRQRKQRHR